MAHCDKCKLGQCKRCDREGIRLVTDVLQERLSLLFLTVAPPMDIPGPADVIIYVSKKADSTEVVRVLCHSCMLKRTGDFFREILEYTKTVSRRPTLRPPSFVLDRNSFFMEPDGEGGYKGPAARTIYMDVKRGSVTGLKRQSVVAKPGEEALYERESMMLAQRASMSAGADGIAGKQGEPGKYGTFCGPAEEPEAAEVMVAALAGRGDAEMPEVEKRRSGASEKKRVTLIDPKVDGENVARRGSVQTGRDEGREGDSGAGRGLGDELSAKLGALLAGGKTREETGARESGLVFVPEMEADPPRGPVEPDRPPSVEGGEMADEPCSIRNEFLDLQMAMEAAKRETADERETLVRFHKNGVAVGKYYVKLKMLSWTESMLLALLEYIYTDRCHLTIRELPLVYAAADKMMLTSFTQAVRHRDLVPYVRFAMENEDNRKAVLKLCQLARCEELDSVHRLCEAFTYEKGKTSKDVHILVFQAAKRLGRHENVFGQGFRNHLGFNFCILRDLPPPYKHGYPEECFKNPQWSRSRRSLLNTYGLVLGPPGSKSERDAKDLEYLVVARQAQGIWDVAKRPDPEEWCTSLREEKNADKSWRVYLFGQEIARTCYSFFRYATGLNHRPMSPESFSLRMISGLIVGDILVEVLKKAIPRGLDVVQRRGSGYFIGGFNYGNNITMYGDPIKLLEAAKAIPKDMIGRAALRIDFPSERTFVTYLSTTTTVGVQIEATARLFFVKPLANLISILEYATGMSKDAFVPWEEPRTMVELVKAVEPF